LTHVRSDRVEEHFSRLVRETEGLVDWIFALNPGKFPALEIGIACQPAAQSMPARYDEMMRNGGMLGGYLDTTLIPGILAIEADFTWVMEFDVDFSGRWSRFFRQFATDPADFLTTTIVRRPYSPDWRWWPGAKAPDTISSERMFRAFNPIMRVSRRYARLYKRTLAVEGWAGHYEFIMPTLAVSSGLHVMDIGGALASKPETWAGANYVNDPLHPFLRPGTFRWRPAQPFYFHEQTERFPLPDKLYHPIKPDTPVPEQRLRSNRPGRSPPSLQ
jgi:hypothetical protein